MARIDVTRVYPQLDRDGRWQDQCNYEPMVEAFGRTICSVDTDDYQGDSFRLLADGDEPDQKYGLMVFGWGSCSGCDALQACASVKELQELMDHLQDQIRWFADKESLLKFMMEHDWEGDWHWHRSEAHQFRKKVMEFLNSESV